MVWNHRSPQKVINSAATDHGQRTYKKAGEQKCAREGHDKGKQDGDVVGKGHAPKPAQRHKGQIKLRSNAVGSKVPSSRVECQRVDGRVHVLA